MQTPLVLVNASCDVPDAVLHTGTVAVMPIHLVLQDAHYMDQRHPQETLAWLQQMQRIGPALGLAQPLAPQEVAMAMQALLGASSGPLLVLHGNGVRSHFPAALQAVLAQLGRDPAQAADAQRVHVVDSGCLLAGYGAQLMDFLATDQRTENWPARLRRAQHNALHAHSFSVPTRLDFIEAQVARKGDHGINRVAHLAARIRNDALILYGNAGETRVVGSRPTVALAREAMLGKLRLAIRNDLLLSRHVVISYAGELAELDTMPGYQRLLGLAETYRVQVHQAVMSVASALHIGPGTLSVGWLAHAGRGK